jgi:hypothetical protein
MDRKYWIWITVALALGHTLIAYILTPMAGEIVFSRFDGEAYSSPWSPLLVGLYFVLHFPYLLVVYFFRPVRFLPPRLVYFLVWVGNSLLWGLAGAWLVSRLPFMKKGNHPRKSDSHPTEVEEQSDPD